MSSITTDKSDLQDEISRPTRMHPKKFILWLFIVSICMVFASLTSGYIVRQAEGNWEVFQLPTMLYYSTGIILLSSITMHWALINARKDNMVMLKIAMLITTLLGVAFLVSQYLGWEQLQDQGIYLKGNPSGGFLYILTGVHGAHLISGVIFLLIMLVATFNYKVHSRQIVKMEICANYWHFLDIVWVYLFVFLLFN
ncbi:MAG: cytochrome c oxidase subunit 3 [Flammeovirgaceae bacterium]|jgi:cytochrome c oxidase subunit 3